MIRGEKCERVKRSINASKNENLTVELPVYNEIYDPKSDPGARINWGGTLNEFTMRRVWEIARVADGKLITFTHSQNKRFETTSKDKTVPKLMKNNTQTHDHYICNYNSMHYLRQLNDIVKKGDKISTIPLLETVMGLQWGTVTVAQLATMLAF